MKFTPALWSSVSYLELRAVWVKGFRNGNLNRLDRFKRAFYRACMLYARRTGRIVNRLLIGQLREVIDALLSSPRVQALRAGFERAREMLSSRVLVWAPCVKSWLRNETYLVYLGFMRLNDLAYFRP